jgi:hypothetical protein
MRLAVAAIGCGLVWSLAACSGGPGAPAGATGGSSSGGPFTASTVTGPFAPSTVTGPFGAPSGATPGGAPAEMCAAACARLVQAGCTVNNCEADCTDQMSHATAECVAAFGDLLTCMVANCNPNTGRVQQARCIQSLAAVDRCAGSDAATAQPIPGGPGGPGVNQDGGP